jgi:hypothetical protein
MRYILQRMKRFCGFATGVVFFLGGILKLMDPVGAGLVIKEYLDFLHLIIIRNSDDAAHLHLFVSIEDVL